MNIRPLHDRVIVRRMEEERTSPGGIVLPDAPKKSRFRVRCWPPVTASCWKTVTCGPWT